MFLTQDNSKEMKCMLNQQYLITVSYTHLDVYKRQVITTFTHYIISLHKCKTYFLLTFQASL